MIPMTYPKSALLESLESLNQSSWDIIRSLEVGRGKGFYYMSGGCKLIVNKIGLNKISVTIPWDSSSTTEFTI
jgi:hypothetical protein